MRINPTDDAEPGGGQAENAETTLLAGGVMGSKGPEIRVQRHHIHFIYAAHYYYFAPAFRDA